MPTRTAEERAASRAEARRRARLAARGELTDAAEPPADEPEPERRPSLLARLFPPAPPLPNRPDPLEKFDRTAPLAVIREPLHLLRRNPLAWMLPSLACFVGYFLSLQGGRNALSLLGTFLTFGSIIAAGWFGWQRPALFGTVTALIGYGLLLTVVAATLVTLGAEDALALTTPVQIVVGLSLQAILGLIGGWYGGYLRRRQAHVTAEARRTSSARRRR